MHLADQALKHSFRLVCYEQLGSTNDEAARLAKAGDPGRLWVVADEQTDGRGRHGRHWSSPPGNLYASLLLVEPGPIHRTPELGFVAGVALARALRELFGGDTRLRIKWPNDILYEGAKLAGVLLESIRLADGRFACIIGCGVNCCSHPEGLALPATDLAAIGMPLGGPAEVLARISAEFVPWLDSWLNSLDFEPIRAEWLSLAAGIGTNIRISNPARIAEGLFRTIDSQGRLILATQTGDIAIEAGEVFLSAQPKGALTAL